MDTCCIIDWQGMTGSVEASDLGWAPGEWPHSFVVSHPVRGNITMQWRSFVVSHPVRGNITMRWHSREYSTGSHVYVNDGGIKVVVFND